MQDPIEVFSGFQYFLIVLIVIVAVIVIVYVWYLFWALRKKPATGVESLVGAKGVVYSETLATEGEVSINGVIWRARLANPSTGPLKKGEEIVVSRFEELTLIVELKK
jgi:membrane protein implicated in regulation of membrane protease activity